jgi:integrase/recombinase XerC
LKSDNTPYQLTLPKTSTIPRRPLTQNEIDQLFTLSRNDPMNYAIFRIAYHTSARANEICNIDLNHINRDEKEITLYNEKAKRWETIPVSEECITAIDNYLTIRGKTKGKDSQNALFINRFGKRIQYRSVLDNFHRYGVKLKLNRTLHPHLIRHTTITQLAEQGKSVFEIQTISHHKDLRALQKYVHISKDKKREIAESLDNKPSNTNKMNVNSDQTPSMKENQKISDHYTTDDISRQEAIKLYKMKIISAKELQDLLKPVDNSGDSSYNSMFS